ncbi:MAG: phosphotyrosine protein phosphatase [Variovorax sp.]|nr:MAG: phosphotyrosine protein phosphatase [Variovorax sp.]
MTARRNILFVCSRNEWRSPTAEQVFRRHPALAVRSAGTSASARRRVSATDVAWADVIVVMENRHKTRLAQDHAELLAGKPLHVLDIPDDYGFMDAELIELLEAAVPALLGLPG